MEVHHGVVVDRDPEILIDRLNQSLGPTERERGVDPSLTATCDIDPQVTRQREQRRLLRLRFDAQHHDRVGVE